MFKSLFQQSFTTGMKTFTAMPLNPSYGFATKSLKLIKSRMKAVLSIKKITKVHDTSYGRL